MSAQIYSITGQTESRRKAFLEWKTIDLSYKLTHVGVMLTIIKVFIILFLLVGIGNLMAVLKINQ